MEVETNIIIYKELSYRIVGLAMEVHNKLGHGFLEKVYENALMLRLNEAGINAEPPKGIDVFFRDQVIGTYYADIMVDEKIIFELKSVEHITAAHKAQTLNYLKATRTKLGIIINFGKSRLEYERLVF